MARGTVKTPEQKIAELKAEKVKYQGKIDGYKAKITELDQKIKEISNEQKETKINELMQAIIESGKTVDEVLEAIKK